MAEIPLHILTDAGFTEAEANDIVDHLIQGVDMHDGNGGAERLDVESLPEGKREAFEKFSMAVAADA